MKKNSLVLKLIITFFLIGSSLTCKLFAQYDTISVIYLNRIAKEKSKKLQPEPDIYYSHPYDSLRNPIKPPIKTKNSNIFLVPIPKYQDKEYEITFTVKSIRFFDGIETFETSTLLENRSVDIYLSPVKDRITGYDFLKVQSKRRKRWLIGIGFVSAGVVLWGHYKGKRAGELYSNYQTYTNEIIFMSKFSQTRDEALKKANKLKNDQRKILGILTVPLIAVTLTPWNWGMYK